MNKRLNIISTLLICFGLIAGCSSSSNSPEADSTETATGSGQELAGNGADGGSTDVGESGSDAGADAGNVDVSETVAGSGTIDLNGDYDVTVSLSAASLAVPECASGDGTLTVTGTAITGIVDDEFTISGSIASDGTITAGLALVDDINPFATFDGMLDGEALAGTWKDIRGCSGTWRAEKSLVE